MKRNTRKDRKRNWRIASIAQMDRILSYRRHWYASKRREMRAQDQQVIKSLP